MEYHAQFQRISYLFGFAEVRKDIAGYFLGCKALLCHQEYAVLFQIMPRIVNNALNNFIFFITYHKIKK